MGILQAVAEPMRSVLFHALHWCQQDGCGMTNRNNCWTLTSLMEMNVCFHSRQCEASFQGKHCTVAWRRFHT